MIRFFYWLIVIIEVCLLLAALLLFIITDARTIKYIAKTSLDSSGLNYESLKGNFFDGLEVQKLSYDNKLLFSSALIYWNPLTLFHEKLTVTKLDIKGIEVENIITMVNKIKSDESEKSLGLDFSIVLNNIHLDINSYAYEGIKFSSFVFETGEINIDKNLTVNADSLDLKFDSDIVNVNLDAKIKDNALIIDNLELKNISANDITTLTQRLKRKYKKQKSHGASSKENNNTLSLKKIKVKHILGTMKAVEYGDFKIKKVALHLYDGIIDPSKNFNYQVKKLDFKGETNFGKLDYKGYIKDANIHAKGNIRLDKKLFKKYSLPLHLKDFKKLPSSLRLNHYGVWIDIDHNVTKLLKIKSDFNLDIINSTHKLHYDYEDALFTVDSDITGRMTYAKKFQLQNRVRIDEEGFSYEGEVKVLKPTSLPSFVSEYLVKELNATYKANTKDFKMQLESDLLTGSLTMPKYRYAKVFLKSKKSNIELNKFIPDLPLSLEDETMSVESTGFFDFKSFKKSKIELATQSKTLNVNAKMKLEKPYIMNFSTKVNNDKALKKIVPKLNFSKLKKLNGSVKFGETNYLINVKSQELNVFIDYNSVDKAIQRGVLHLGQQEFSFNSSHNKSLILQTEIFNIKKLLDEVKRYYYMEVPNIKGNIDLRLEKQSNGTILINLKSPELKYQGEGNEDSLTTNVYDIDIALKVDKNFNIEIKNYQFKLDDNGYLNTFYSNRTSYLSIKNEEIKIKKLWLNDKIEIWGNYNIEMLKGKLNIDAKSYELSTKDFALVLDLDLTVKLDKERLNIEGDVGILGDTITYEVVGTDIVEDADIVIIEDMVKEKESAFNNLKLYIKIKSKKPLKYIAENVNVEFFNELSLLKNYNQKMLLTGVTTITDGYYQLEEKQFILDESHLYFTGDIKSPLLDIKANYEKDEYNIHVFISGTTDAPIVNFNSEPFLTQQEILSLILFDGTGSSSGKGAEAYTLLGGTFAKGLIKSLGIDVDHLLLGTDRDEQLSLEVGRKVSRNVSVLYLRKDGLDGVKVRVEHSKSFETDIIIQPPNTSSIEFLYKHDQ